MGLAWLSALNSSETSDVRDRCDGVDVELTSEVRRHEPQLARTLDCNAASDAFSAQLSSD